MNSFVIFDDPYFNFTYKEECPLPEPDISVVKIFGNPVDVASRAAEYAGLDYYFKLQIFYPSNTLTEIEVLIDKLEEHESVLAVANENHSASRCV